MSAGSGRKGRLSIVIIIMGRRSASDLTMPEAICIRNDRLPSVLMQHSPFICPLVFCIVFTCIYQPTLILTLTTSIIHKYVLLETSHSYIPPLLTWLNITNISVYSQWTFPPSTTTSPRSSPASNPSNALTKISPIGSGTSKPSSVPKNPTKKWPVYHIPFSIGRQPSQSEQNQLQIEWNRKKTGVE